MKNLVIGNTSQQSYYYPDDYIKISSRNVDFNYLRENSWDSVYITFAEQRVYDDNINYFNTNYIYTLKIIENLIQNSNKIVVFLSCELWNNYAGQIDLTMNFSFKPKLSGFTEYLLIKKMLHNEIKKRRQENNLYNNVIMIHPFNFNSVYRSEYFLFGKIFNSIINKKKIEIGNTYYYRDIIHTKYLVSRVIESKEDEIIGSGRLYYVNDFIRDLYKYFDMNYNEYIIEDVKITNNSEKLYYSYQEKIYTYDMLLNDTIEDLKNKIVK
jgi:nucleoside-diphosphate-sugar epimerase